MFKIQESLHKNTYCWLFLKDLVIFHLPSSVAATGCGEAGMLTLRSANLRAPHHLGCHSEDSGRTQSPS